ncbi:MAG: DEAD/DEAH box helicase family protein [Gammaproteobacteria bacterium]|nr:DEAD/DEAH box helicase family protein [Gammaproteobacteria bacterium]
MDRVEETASIVKELNLYFNNKISDHEFVKKVCLYFDKIKNEKLVSSDLQFLKYISNISGVPHYYDLLLDKFNKESHLECIDLNTLSAIVYESTLYADNSIKLHKFQKDVLSKFNKSRKNRYFLSATTSFGKTFLIYEIIKKLAYKNIVLIFPTIALLSENYEKLITDSRYSNFKEEFGIHTLSEVEEFQDKNIFIFTPERYLSFIDKNPSLNMDFVFVDEIYKIDNEYLVDAISSENERDTAYRVALQDILSSDKSDVLLVGPYIEFPKTNDSVVNQSFNKFLDSYEFEILNYNNYEIVGKSIDTVKNGITIIDDKLTLGLQGYSKKTKKQRVFKVVSALREIGENAILYTLGPGMAESYAKGIVGLDNSNYDISDQLKEFIEHLRTSYGHDEWIVIKALQFKIGIHHGLVPKYIQKEIIELFNNGCLDMLISTTTITEGVNTSAKNLLVINASKGDKSLKTFDAKNIAGRAGRFLHHFTGRVLIFDKKFSEIINGSDNEIKHKNYDVNSIKDEIDYFITDEQYLNSEDIVHKKALLERQLERGIPDEVMRMYKVISYSDKLDVYDNILDLSPYEQAEIQALIKSINISMTIDYKGFKNVLKVIAPIVKNQQLEFLINNQRPLKKGGNAGARFPILVYALSAYLSDGFAGSIKYNLTRVDGKDEKFTVDRAVRESSKFIFNTLKYQLVKYLGVFNIMYKYHQSNISGKPIEELGGLDRLLLKLEYNATSDKGRLASDYGVPSKIVEYYDGNEAVAIRNKFDRYEYSKFLKMEEIFRKNEK